MVTLEHVALWTTKLEELKQFYVRHFGGVAGPRYENPSKGFASYFITFAGGSRLEIMQMVSVPRSQDDVHRQFTGFIHIAFALPSATEVDRLTGILRRDGCELVEGPRRTGDGYYESVILDPDGNRVELSCVSATVQSSTG
jgi:lactoylglutathione lyase